MSDLLKQGELDRLINSCGEQNLDGNQEHRSGNIAQKQGGRDKNKSKFDLILDVPVRSRVVVGKTQRKLQDLLALKPGMIVETENIVTDQVELYVNDHVIALGEVVVVGEHYGFRVKKIVTPVERIRKLT